MITDFVHHSPPMRVSFGYGALQRVRQEAEHFGLTRLLILCTPNQRTLAVRVAQLLGDLATGIFDQARMHVPVEIARAGCDQARELGADGCIAVGGGSTIGLGKAVALTEGLPVLAVPTTYSGSEMTQVWGLTEDGQKKTGRDPLVLPRSVIYDPELTMAVPTDVLRTSGLNAIAHAMEALYAPDGSPLTSLMAERAVRSLADSLPSIGVDGNDAEARAVSLFGAWLCGACLGSTTMGLHHKLCHVLGGTFDLPHAPTHAVLLPHVAAFTLAAEPDARAVLQRALRTDSPARAFADLGARVGVPKSLAALGLQERDIDSVVEQTHLSTYSSKHPATRGELRKMVLGAFRGDSVEHDRQKS